jgi:acetoin utilization protein AcuB
MRVEEVMTRDVLTVASTTPAADAWDLMRARRIHHLVVMDGSTVAGVLSDRDTGGRSGASVRARSTVADLMTGRAVTVAPRDTIRRVANLMKGRTIGCLPVLNRGRLVGIVTVSDLLELLGRGIDRPAKGERAALHHRRPHRKNRRASGMW